LRRLLDCSVLSSIALYEICSFDILRLWGQEFVAPLGDLGVAVMVVVDETGIACEKMFAEINSIRRWFYY